MKLDPARLTLPFIPKLIASAAFALCAGHALAVEPFTVKDIRVEGIQRTEAGTVFSYLPVRVGDTFNDEKAAAAIKALAGLSCEVHPIASAEYPTPAKRPFYSVMDTSLIQQNFEVAIPKWEESLRLCIANLKLATA